MDGYNFAINKMHFILSKYPVKTEVYLRETHVPDLHEYQAWKKVSTIALTQKLSVEETLQAYERQLHTNKNHGDSNFRRGSPTRSSATTVVMADSPEVDAARILSAIHFKAITMNGSLRIDGPASAMSIDSPCSPVFPRPDELPVPAGADAWLLNPVLEDAQRRWVKGFHKEDQTREVVKTDAEGKRIWLQKTVYIVDGEEFHDVDPKRTKGARAAAMRRIPRITTLNLGSNAMAMVATREAQSAKRPIDSGVFMDDDGESPVQKRRRVDTEDDLPLSSMSRPGGISFRSPTVSEISEQDATDLHHDLASASSSYLQALNDQTVFLPPQIKITPTRAPKISARSGSSRRKPPPAPLNLAVPQHSRYENPPSSPSPVKPTITPRKRAPPTPQHSSPTIRTPSKSKYVPNTPNPMRWTAAELYHLNGLARRGMHPRELHPLMMEQFPDKPRSIHAIKDRRDKMSRAKELQGRVPDYQAKYGELDG